LLLFLLIQFAGTFPAVFLDLLAMLSLMRFAAD